MTGYRLQATGYRLQATLLPPIHCTRQRKQSRLGETYHSTVFQSATVMTGSPRVMCPAAALGPSAISTEPLVSEDH